MKTVIISDLHLGARNSRTDLLADLLRGGFDRLILNGDIVDSPDPRLFRRADWRVIDQLRGVARAGALVVVRGNHDELPGPTNPRGSTGYLADLLGVAVVPEYALDVGGARYLVLHGDQFDRTLNLTWVGDVADWCYRGVQRLSRPAAHGLKVLSKSLCGVVAAVRHGALSYARDRGYAGVITGHTHFSHDEIVAGDGFHFLNTGCWVDAPCSYVAVGGGRAALRHWATAAGRVACPVGGTSSLVEVAS